ncbi:HNH endonuclease family protein [Gordonia sp. X0973]|uniref:HNH endonuclease family protein n=1 Tax=Gordonia sp. X0973 TaxID=2742602 RepID=UPI002657434C|nr:HNH endonuclease family protein [Gordonia sp. X0973]
MIHRFRTAAVVLAGLLVLSESGCGLQDYLLEKAESVSASGIPSTVAIGPASTYIDTAGLGKLLRLPVRRRVSMQGYTRDAFGPLWDDNVDVEFGHNGCNTRDDILRRDLTDVVMRPGGCFVSTGTLHDQYTGQAVAFVRGPTTSGAVEIDHLVSLANAWTTGARYFDDAKRRNLANDPRNLQAVQRWVNQDKGPMDAAVFLPPNRAYRCTYVNRQIDVKLAYGLWVTQNEAAAMRAVLATCVKA